MEGRGGRVELKLDPYSSTATVACRVHAASVRGGSRIVEHAIASLDEDRAKGDKRARDPLARADARFVTSDAREPIAHDLRAQFVAPATGVFG